MLEKSRVTPQRGNLFARFPYCLGSPDPVGDVPSHCVLLLGLGGQTKGNELCVSPCLDWGPAELAGAVLGSVWLTQAAAAVCQGALFAFSTACPQFGHCVQRAAVLGVISSGYGILGLERENLNQTSKSY